MDRIDVGKLDQNCAGMAFIPLNRGVTATLGNLIQIMIKEGGSLTLGTDVDKPDLILIVH
jgi:hypothetical protein